VASNEQKIDWGCIVVVIVAVIFVVSIVLMAVSGVNFDPAPQWDTRCNALGLHKGTTSNQDCQDLIKKLQESADIIDRNG